jgi:hypothetical protein
MTQENLCANHRLDCVIGHQTKQTLQHNNELSGQSDLCERSHNQARTRPMREPQMPPFLNASGSANEPAPTTALKMLKNTWTGLTKKKYEDVNGEQSETV